MSELIGKMGTKNKQRSDLSSAMKRSVEETQFKTTRNIIEKEEITLQTRKEPVKVASGDPAPSPEIETQPLPVRELPSEIKISRPPLIKASSESGAVVQLPSFKRGNSGKSTPPTAPTIKASLPTKSSDLTTPSKRKREDPPLPVLNPAGPAPLLKKFRLNPPPKPAPGPEIPDIQPIEGIDFKSLHLHGKLGTLSMTDMKSFLKKKGLPTQGKKPDLQKRIEVYYLNEGVED